MCEYYEKADGEVNQMMPLMRYDDPNSLHAVPLHTVQRKFGSVFKRTWQGAALYHTSAIINTPLYLSSMWQAIRTLHPSSQWRSEQLQGHAAVAQLSQAFDDVILACGADVLNLWGMEAPAPPALTLVRGQNLIKRTPPTDREQHALLCGEYIGRL